MAEEQKYLNNRYMGESLDAYAPGGFHPIYLGDVFKNRYIVFRKLGTGSQSTVWLARDIDAPSRRFVAIKVLTAKSSPGVQKLVASLQLLDHPGENYVELPLDSFALHGPNGDHVCMVLEPLGNTLIELVDEAYNVRIERNELSSGEPSPSLGDPWSVVFAKRVCWQMLQGLHFMHERRIAHRDIRPSNNCFALTYDLSALSENEIQKSVWPDENIEDEKQAQAESTGRSERPDAESSGNDSDSDDYSDDDDPPSQWEIDMKECKRRSAEQWQACDRGDPNAEPHSDEWNKANFYNSRDNIELPQRKDGKPLGPDEIRYTVGPTPLTMRFDLERVTHPEQPFRIVLTDMGFACPFEECEQRRGPTLSDYMPPEDLLRIPATYKADIFSLGLWCWEVVMLRTLVEHQLQRDDPEYTKVRNRLLHSLAKRIGPIPAVLRAQWPDADKWVDAEGSPVDIHEQEEYDYGDDPYPQGDIWQQAQERKPQNMSNEDMEAFVRLVLRMLQWQPELRPSTSELLQDVWFHDISGISK
ncbi:hypothetical protein SCAR479_00385 [Seiridium cardinale]|uniref:non-specific serine/threonine protein kinase n=1 Tax=Seiridium cardinale TaxID=138064 RepID=A0ABR2Y9Q9_9PEZI